MKNFAFPASVFALSVFLMAACGKKYHCECSRFPLLYNKTDTVKSVLHPGEDSLIRITPVYKTKSDTTITGISDRYTKKKMIKGENACIRQTKSYASENVECVWIAD